MYRVFLPPLLAVVGGVGGFFLRRWELSTAFDSNGLALAGAPATVLLLLLSALAALALALLCRGSKAELKSHCDAFSAQGNWPWLIIAAVSAVCLVAAAVLGLRQTLSVEGVFSLHGLLWLMEVVSFACIIQVILSNFRAKPESYSMLLLIPAYTCCLWLVSAYQQQAADPVILDYVYEMFAIICALLGFYFTAGFSFGRGRIWPCAFFSLLSIYFSLVTLADGHSTAVRLLFLFVILYQFANVTALLLHAFPVKGSPAAVETEETNPISETNETQEVTPDE